MPCLESFIRLFRFNKIIVVKLLSDKEKADVRKLLDDRGLIFIITDITDININLPDITLDNFDGNKHKMSFQSVMLLRMLSTENVLDSVIPTVFSTNE